MLTVEHLRQSPELVKAFTGLPAEEFWGVVVELTARWAGYQQRQKRPARRRAAGDAVSRRWRCAWR